MQEKSPVRGPSALLRKPMFRHGMFSAVKESKAVLTELCEVVFGESSL